ncbi:MAG: sensor histidine kinase [Verrucomicrobiales bacterium]|nr:sensor histidine kinase [Verrucomicrobiales bacterium]
MVKLAEGELRANQQLLASILDNISEAVYRTDRNHELIFANRAYLQLSGYESLEEMRNIPRETLYANPAERAQLLEALATDGEFRNVEIEFVRRDGQHWWGLSNSVAVRDPQTNAVLYHVGSVKDVTRRKKAQEELLQLNATLERRITERTAELAASEARLRTLVEHAPEAIVVFDGDTGKFISGNPHVCEIFGLYADKLTLLTPADISPEFQADGRSSKVVAREKMNEALAGGTPVFEWIHRHTSGKLIPTEVRLVRLPAAGQNLLRASIIDTSERKRAEEALRESEEKFRALFEASSAGVMLHDENEYLQVNPAAVRMLGYEREEDLIGKSPAMTSPPVQPNGVGSDIMARQHIIDCMTKGSARFDWMARRASGEDLPVEVILTRVEVGGRKIIQAVVNDIAERKKAEAELLKALAREKELGALKSSFVSMVSHEFRTPLGVIMSSAEILEDYFDRLEAADRKEHLGSIRKNTRRMSDLMEEVLVLSRFDAGKMEFKPAGLNLRQFCQRVVDEVLSATNRQCPINLSIADSIGDVMADERLLRHIFTNLLFNAVKYSAAGTPVALSLERDGPDVICHIEDHGIGIPEMDLPWLFNAFYRGRNVGSRSGTGLGLVIVKRCVELHGGKLNVESKMGEGTHIRVRLTVFES